MARFNRLPDRLAHRLFGGNLRDDLLPLPDVDAENVILIAVFLDELFNRRAFRGIQGIKRLLNRLPLLHVGRGFLDSVLQKLLRGSIVASCLDGLGVFFV